MLIAHPLCPWFAFTNPHVISQNPIFRLLLMTSNTHFNHLLHMEWNFSIVLFCGCDGMGCVVVSQSVESLVTSSSIVDTWHLHICMGWHYSLFSIVLFCGWNGMGWMVVSQSVESLVTSHYQQQRRGHLTWVCSLILTASHHHHIYHFGHIYITLFTYISHWSHIYQA